MKKYLSKFLCVCEAEEQVQNQKSQSSSDHYSMIKPKKANIVALLNEINQKNQEYQFAINSQQTNILLVQKTEKHFKFKENDYRTNHLNIFDCYYDSQLIYDFTMKHIAPQKLTKYIAQRCAGTFQLLEINSQYSQHTIQFAKVGILVTAINSNNKQLQEGAYNIRQYKVQGSIDLLNADFLKYRFYKMPQFDGIFLNLCGYHKMQQLQIYSLLQKCLAISQNLIIFTQQKTTDFLLDFFTEFTILEKEIIMMNGVQEITIIYLGKFCSIQQQNILDSISNSLPLGYYQEYDLTLSMRHILLDICQNYDVQLLVRTFFHALRRVDSVEQLLYAFLQELQEKEILTKEKLHDIHVTAAQSPNMYKQSIKNHPSTQNYIFKQSQSSDDGVAFSLRYQSENQQSVFDQTLQTGNFKQ